MRAVLDAAAGTLLQVAPGRAGLVYDRYGPLPVAARSVEELSLERLPELDPPEVYSLLRECRDSLVPGGRVLLRASELMAALGATGADGLAAHARRVGLELQSIETREQDNHSTLVLGRPVRTAEVEPLVSILVPGYRTRFLDVAVLSARSQTWENLEILVGDDSADDALERTVQRHVKVDSRVRYVGHAAERGGRANMVHLLGEARGTYVKFLNDDDVLASECVERMVRCLQVVSTASLVTSHRRPIDASGRFLPDLEPTKRRVPFDAVIAGQSAAFDVLRRTMNWIGEPSTTMFRLDEIDQSDPFGVTEDPVISNGDMALWLKLLARGDLVYLTESLSQFRQHDDQRQRSPEFRERAVAGLEQVLEGAVSIGLAHPRSVIWRATPLDVKPWWSDRTRDALVDADDRGLVELRDEMGQDEAVFLAVAQLELEREDPVAAATELARGLLDHPESVPIRKQLAIVMLILGDVEEATRLLLEVLALCPYDEDSRSTVAALSR